MREFELLQHIFDANETLPDTVTIPPGDDMGAVRFCRMSALIAVDQLVESVHFDTATTPIKKIGRKAITRSLSDVAAMAASPVGAVVAGCLPREFGQERASELFDVMRRVGQSYRCPLIGGDITIWEHPLVLTVTMIATPEGIRPLLRGGAQVGDAICVTGQLGGALETINGYTHHLDFEPRLALARSLGANPDLDLHAMIDLSDGLAKDLSHICRTSSVGAEIAVDALPIGPAAQAAARRDGRPAWQHAVGDGEDYELCFTLPTTQVDPGRSTQIAGVDITPIGRITEPRPDDEPNIMLKQSDGSLEPLDPQLGWEHASQASHGR